MAELERRLAAIMFTDIVGFTARTQRNEALAMGVLAEHNRLLRSIFPKYNGREVKTIGDSFLVEFSSALEAVRCAVAMQQGVHERNLGLPAEDGIGLRIGIHVGDVIHSGGDILGDAVNVSSRIQPLAESGGICISEQVYDQVRNKFEFPFQRIERRGLKNVSQPIDVYRIILPWAGSGAGRPSSPDKQRLVILPLVNISADSKDEFFADGMTEELIATLSKIRGLKVIARTSAMRYKGEKKTVGEIGRELNVASLLEGSVRRADNRVRINVQLVDTSSEEQLWSEKYDRELQDVFAVQSDIAQQVAKALEVKLRDVESSLLGKQQTQNTGAYTLYLRGRYHWNTRLEDGLSKGVKFFEEAIARDPGYALAYVGLADCYSMLGLYGHRRPSTVYPTARNYVTKALDLDESLAEAHASMGEILMQYYYEWDAAGYELDRALELNPNYATARLWKSTFLVAQGRIDEAIAECRLGEEIDPLSMIIATELGKTLYFARRYDDALEQYGRSLEIDPNFAIAHKGLAEVYSQIPDFERSLREIQKAIELSKGSVFILDDAGYIYAISGRRGDAEKVLEDLEKMSTETYVTPFGRAAIYAGLGDKDKTMEWLEKAYEERSFLTWLKVDPAFDSLRDDPRFISLLAKMGLGRNRRSEK